MLYPKAIYKGEHQTSWDVFTALVASRKIETITVNSEQEENAKREQGYLTAGELMSEPTPIEAAAKRGRPPKNDDGA